MIKLKKHNRSTGQALVEFAIMAVVLMMIIFIIIEAARILWAWGTVQNAAREGARYAITGQYDWPDCAVSSLSKFNTPEYCDDLRVASVISRTHKGLTGLPLNETSGAFEDKDYYQIEVWGVNQGGALQKNFAGMPSMPVIVRAYYRVPIISPFFSSILPSIPVFGQVTMYNESFGQLGGGSNQGAALPPPIPAIPTAGVTPSPTFTPTPDPSTNTPTAEPSNTPTSTPDFCRVHFEGAAVQGNEYVYVTGEVGTLVRIIDLSQGGIQISAVHTVAGPFDNHLCPGFVTVFLTEPLQYGHEIAVESSDTSVDITSVLPGTPTPTATNTPSVTPTEVATETPVSPTPAPSATPRDPYIIVLPTCGSPDINGNVRITLLGYNWPDSRDIAIYWDSQGNTRSLVSRGHGGSFTLSWLESEVSLPDGNTTNSYSVLAYANGVTPAVATYQVPCDNATVVPTSTATITPTPNPADLLIVGPPQLATEGDIIGYSPVDFSVVISNTGDVDITNQFFVDLYLDPAGPIDPSAERIPVEQSSGYAGVSSLPGNSSRVITITAPFGFENQPINHEVYGMVDSIEQIEEVYETNNISAMATADYVTPGPTPTPSPTPISGGENTIIGIVSWVSPDGLDPLNRAFVYLYNSSGILVNFTRADSGGFYQFQSLPDDTYTIRACGNLDVDRYGARTGIIIPSVLPVVNIYTDPVACP